MKYLKYNLSFKVILVILVSVLSFSCGKTGLDPDPSSVENWILGSSLSIREDSSESEEFCQKVVQAADAQTYGVELAIECLPRTCLGNSSEEILWLLEGNENLGVCCDVNHLLQETPEEFIQKVGSHITTLHISDYDGLDEKHWRPGEGIINWNLVIKNLLSAGYTGPFLFEYKDTPEKKAEVWQNLKSEFLQSF